MALIRWEPAAELNTIQNEMNRLFERAFGTFARSLTLPDGVDPDGVHAHFDCGVLEIRIPKPEQKKPRQVQIKLGTNAGQDSKAIESAAAGHPQANSHDPASAPA